MLEQIPSVSVHTKESVNVWYKQIRVRRHNGYPGKGQLSMFVQMFITVSTH
jgi:hypothetical protein